MMTILRSPSSRTRVTREKCAWVQKLLSRLQPSAAVIMLSAPHLAGGLTFPFFKDFVLNLGWFYLPFGLLVIVGAGNAVNLTDGLDGLAIVPVMIAGATFGLIAYLSGNAVFANYLQIHHVPGTGNWLCSVVP